MLHLNVSTLLFSFFQLQSPCNRSKSFCSSYYFKINFELIGTHLKQCYCFGWVYYSSITLIHSRKVMHNSSRSFLHIAPLLKHINGCLPPPSASVCLESCRFLGRALSHTPMLDLQESSPFRACLVTPIPPIPH